MLRIHHDVIRDARVVKALSGSVMLLYTTESELFVTSSYMPFCLATK